MRKDDAERELDAALARYAAAEPREGLEQRVLANLRAQGARTAQFEWRRWGAVGFAVAGFAGLAIWAGARHSAVVNVKPVVVKHEAAETGGSVSAALAKNESNLGRIQEHSHSSLVAKGAEKRRRGVARASAEAAPKLAQFPAPEPLTEQEKLLVQFVEQDPEGAALFAEVRAKELQRASDEMKLLGDGKDLQEGQTY
jgi:hypothetical protein